MTEKEKMVAGLWYDANNDQELIDQRLVCQAVSYTHLTLPTMCQV